MNKTEHTIVAVENVFKEYGKGPAAAIALAGVSLAINSGSFLALCGPSGSGKTTLLNLIGALDAPTSGSVTVSGQNLTNLSRSALAQLRRDQIGFVFQAYNLIPVYTAFENAAFTLGLQKLPKEERRARAMQALADVGLAGLEHRLPKELSGGQQQRVAVARAVAARPAVILADEPTANLDSKTANALIDMMQGLNQEKGMTFVFSTHDLRIVKRASHTVWMQDGQIVQEPIREVE